MDNHGNNDDDLQLCFVLFGVFFVWLGGVELVMVSGRWGG